MRVSRTVDGGSLNIPKVLWVDTLKSNQNLVVVDRLADEAVGIWKLLKKRKNGDDSTKVANTADEYEYNFSALEEEIELVYLNYSFNGFAKENSNVNQWVSNKDELLNVIRQRLFDRSKDQLLMQVMEGVKASEKFKSKINAKVVKSNNTMEDERIKNEIQAVYLNELQRWAKANIESVFKEDCKYHIPKVVPTMVAKVLAYFDQIIIDEYNNDLVPFFQIKGRVTHGKISYNNYAFVGRYHDWKFDFKEVTFDWKERDVEIPNTVVWPQGVEHRVAQFESSIYGKECALKNDITFIEGGFKVDFKKEKDQFEKDYAKKYEEKELYHDYSFICKAPRKNLLSAGFTASMIAKMPTTCMYWYPNHTPVK